MTDGDRDWERVVRHLQEYDRRFRLVPPRPEPVLPPDLDVEAELDRCFSQPGVSVWVSVV
jgi:hypothetical protein